MSGSYFPLGSSDVCGDVPATLTSGTPHERTATAADLLTNPAYSIPKQNENLPAPYVVGTDATPSGAIGIGGFYRLKQNFLRVFPGLAEAGVPVSVRTQVDHKRVLVYTSLSLIPIILTAVALGTRAIFAFTLSEAREMGSVVQYDYGHFSFCITSKKTSPDILSIADFLPKKSCISYAKFCGRYPQISSSLLDPLPMLADRTAVCSGMFTTATVMHIFSFVFGIIALALLIDNTFVWLNLSFWYQPSHHKSDSIRRVRRFFKSLISAFILLNMLFSMITALLLRTIRHRQHYYPYKLDYGYGFWLCIVVWVFDFIYVVVFFLLNRRVYFAVPIYRGGEVAQGRLAENYMQKHAV